MKTIETQVFEFDELTDTAKEKAREWFRNVNQTFFETSVITESFEEQLSELGYPTNDIQWSLNHCQGDGVAFYGAINTDGLKKLAKRLCSKQDYRSLTRKRTNLSGDTAIDYIEASIDGRNLCASLSYTFNAFHGVLPAVHTTFLLAIEQDINETARKLAKDGYAEIEYQDSAEYIDDAIRANEYTFTVDGHRFG